MGRRRALATLAGLVIVSLALRPQIIAVGPLLPSIRADLAISYGVGGLLAAIPVLCMGIFAPLGPLVARRLGPRLAIAACVGAIVGFGLLRAIAPGALPVILLTFGVGLGLGAVGPILSMIVRLRTPSHAALATGAYATGIVLGSTIAAMVAVPLALGGDDWRRALIVLSLAGLVSLGAWLVLLPPDVTSDANRAKIPVLPWRDSTGWLLGAIFGLQSTLYFGAVAWLPNVYVERGWTQANAASLVGFLNASALIATVGVPVVADRVGSRRLQLAAAAATSVAALAGIVLVPDLGTLWAIVLGLGTGALFPLALTLPVDVADRAEDVGATAALMLLTGYALASAGPFVLGLARDVTGDFTTSLWLLVASAALLVVASAVLSPARLRRGIGRPRIAEPVLPP